MENIITNAGNNCNHQKLNPQFFIPPADHKERYDSIEKAKANAENFYWQPTKWLKSLHKKRQSLIRSESREAIGRFVQVLLHYVHLSNLHVGVPNPGHFWAPSLKELADYAGISFRRAVRVQRVLIAAGYMTVKRRKKFRNGKFIGLVSIRTISEKLFQDLGIKQIKLKFQSIKATGRLKKGFREVEAQVKQLTGKADKWAAWSKYIKQKYLI